MPIDLPVPLSNSPRMTLHAGLAGVALIAVMLAGAWQTIAALQRIDFHALPQTMSDFREGRSTGALEKQIDQKLPERAFLIGVANTLRYQLLHGGGEQVRIGKDGWLFLTDELRYYDSARRHLEARADLLGAAAKSLERDGVKLVVALVPDKARVYPDQLAEGRLPLYTAGRYQEALTALRARGVQTVDLLQPLQRAAANSEVYYRSDTHWNQAGASR